MAPPPRVSLYRQLELALQLADIADAITYGHYESRAFSVENKADNTEVTDADKECESVLREILNVHNPDHAVLGEEAGLIGPEHAEYRWILDPIDGTSNFVKGVPIWATLIALQHVPIDGPHRVVLGVVSAPALQRRWWGAYRRGAFCNGRAIKVSKVDAISGAHLASPGGAIWQKQSAAKGKAYNALAASVWRERGLGDFWQHMLVAEGAFDIACEPIVSLWDLAAIQIIVEEAGGTFTDLAGVAQPSGGSAVSTNGILHAEVLARLNR